MRDAALTEERWEARKEPVGHGWRRAHLEHRAQLVVQRPRTFRQRHVLRDARQIRSLVRRVFEALRKPRCEIGDIGADHRYESPCEKRIGDFAIVILVARIRSEPWARHLLPQDARVQLLQARAWIEPEL